MSVTIDPSNAALIYSPFNWNVQSGSAIAVNAGAYIRTIFQGTSLTLLFNVASNTSPLPQIWVRVDNGGFVQYNLASSISIATGLANIKHTLQIVIKSIDVSQYHYLTPLASFVNFQGLLLDTSTTVFTPTRHAKNVLIYGDSITNGSNSLGVLTPALNGCDTLNSYSFATCSSLDAEFGIVGFDGTGVLLTGNGSTPPWPTTYNNIYQGVSRSFTSPQPDLIITLIGYNDHYTNIQSGMTTVLNALLAATTTAKILVLTPFDLANSHTTELDNAVAATGSTRASRGSVVSAYSTSDTPDGIHPYGYAGTQFIAPALIPLATALLYPTTTTVVKKYSYS